MPLLPLLLHAAGLLFFYSLYGVLQEKIFKGDYGDGARFTSSSLLILVNRPFSISAAICIIVIKTGSAGIASRIKPARPLSAYAAVAGFNFLSTTCQYEALKWVSYTSQSLAKCTKMVPVILIGHFLYKKAHSTRDWVATGVVSLGCATYLFSNPVSKHGSAGAADTGFFDGLVGVALLCGYLFFDGMVSTTQERVFGKNENPGDPFGPGSPVLDQMIWVNAAAGVIAATTCIIQLPTGTLMPNIGLMLTTPALLLDMAVFSATAATGLIVLLNTIASFGALVSSTIMTVRQFLSIVINAGLFGNLAAIGFQGWLGVGWVASGVFIKMNREGSVSNDDMAPVQLRDRSSARVQPYVYPIVVPISMVLLAAVIGQLAPLLLGASASSIAESQMEWSEALRHLVHVSRCPSTLDAEDYPGKRRTALASYPRSGNSYVRTLVERATGFRSTSAHCDPDLEGFFLGECDKQCPHFLYKTHYPAWKRRNPGDVDTWLGSDQAVWLVRNPLDSFHSLFHLDYFHHLPNKAVLQAKGVSAHEYRADIPVLNETCRARLMQFAQNWVKHNRYWYSAPIPRHLMRYEDVRDHPVAQMMTLTAFLTDHHETPSLERLACLGATSSDFEPYATRKVTHFAQWHMYTPELRADLLDVVRPWFCFHGYDKLLRRLRPEDALPDEFCRIAQDEFDVMSALSPAYMDAAPIG